MVSKLTENICDFINVFCISNFYRKRFTVIQFLVLSPKNSPAP